MPDRKKNQRVYRAFNERIKELAVAFEFVDATPTEYVCECVDPECLVAIALTSSEFRDARASRGGFLVVPTHVGEDERVVERGGRFWVVEKIDEKATTLGAG